MTERFDAIVVGAGVVGLAAARALARTGREVVVLEQARTFGTETSSRNSEVIHAGIYYEPGSLKARLCVEGKRRLYAYAARHDVPHRRLGKLIVARSEREHDTLLDLQRNARRSGVTDLEELDVAAIRTLEPDLTVASGLLSPSTGIIDSHGFMRALLADAQRCGAVVAWDSAVVQSAVGSPLRICTADTTVECDVLVNAAGLGAQRVARSMAGMPAESIPPLHLCKGTYFALTCPHRFSHLVYPVPASASLGIHLTLDMGGGARFGPDQQWVDRIDYDVDLSRAGAFYEAVRTYWPGLAEGTLAPAYTGMRGKIAGPAEGSADFMIAGPDTHGVPGLVHLFGIESPGLTASMALADEILRRLGIEPPQDE